MDEKMQERLMRRMERLERRTERMERQRVRLLQEHGLTEAEYRKLKGMEQD